MEGAEKDFPVGRTAGKEIPQHHTHAPGMILILLFSGNHTHNALSFSFTLLNLARDRKNHFSNSVVGVDFPADRPVAPAKIFCRYAGKDGSHGGGFGSAVSGADAVLIKFGRPAIADKNHAIGKWLDGALDTYARRTMAKILGCLPFRGKALP